MASPIQTAAFLFLVLAGVKAADKELGETCTDADSCVHPTLGLVCDVVAKKCMIKHGQSCAGAGHGDLCVAGAECSSGTCTCKASVYSEDTATGQCTATAAKWGSLCPNSNECTDASLQCTAGICVCVDDKQVDLATGLCSVDVATSKVGKVCTTAGEDSANCGSQTTTHLECPTGGGTCFCQRGFAGSIGEDCTAVSGMKVGLACTSGGSECGTQATTHLTCPSANCACESGYYGVPGGDCYPAKGKLDGGCSGSGQGTCEDTNAECTGSAAKKCSCKSGYQAAVARAQSLPASMAVAAQPTRPTQKAPVRTPMPSALQQRVARVAVKLATLELMELGVLKFHNQRLATRAQPTQQPLIAVMPQLRIWNVPPLPRPSASAPPATVGPLVATAQRQSLLAKLAVTAQPTRPTQKARVRTPTPCVLQQPVARVAVKLATLEPMEPGVIIAVVGVYVTIVQSSYNRPDAGGRNARHVGGLKPHPLHSHTPGLAFG